MLSDCKGCLLCWRPRVLALFGSCLISRKPLFLLPLAAKPLHRSFPPLASSIPLFKLDFSVPVPPKRCEDANHVKSRAKTTTKII